ncbi:MAG: DUF975 family protein [Eubacteriales bacterium]
MKTGSISLLKEQSRGALEGRWGESVAYPAVLIALHMIAAAILAAVMKSASVAEVISGAGIAFIMQVLISLFVWGAGYHFLQMLRGRETSFSSLLTVFRMQPDRFVLFGIISGAVRIIPMVPFLIALGQIKDHPLAAVISAVIGAALFIAAILFLLTYAMTVFVLLDCGGSLPTTVAMKQSRRLMRGQKWKFFLTCISFIGWVLLAVITLGLGLLWIIPYVITTMCAFYESTEKGPDMSR